MKSFMLALVLVMSLPCSFAKAGVLVLEDEFGTFGSTSDHLSGMSERLSVAGWAELMPQGAVLTNMLVEVRASLSSVVALENHGNGDALARLQGEMEWRIGSDLLGPLLWTDFMDQQFGLVAPGERLVSDVMTWDTGWRTIFDGQDDGLAQLLQLDIDFTDTVQSGLVSSGNSSAMLATGSAGWLRVTYTFDGIASAPSVPEPVPLLLLASALLGLGLVRRRMA